MDPTKCLEEAREALAKYHKSNDVDDAYFHLMDVAERFAALDEWISNGSFLPSQWMRAHL